MTGQWSASQSLKTAPPRRSAGPTNEGSNLGRRSINLIDRRERSRRIPGGGMLWIVWDREAHLQPNRGGMTAPSG